MIRGRSPSSSTPATLARSDKTPAAKRPRTDAAAAQPTADNRVRSDWGNLSILPQEIRDRIAAYVLPSTAPELTAQQDMYSAANLHQGMGFHRDAAQRYRSRQANASLAWLHGLYEAKAAIAELDEPEHTEVIALVQPLIAPQPESLRELAAKPETSPALRTRQLLTMVAQSPGVYALPTVCQDLAMRSPASSPHLDLIGLPGHVIAMTAWVVDTDTGVGPEMVEEAVDDAAQLPLPLRVKALRDAGSVFIDDPAKVAETTEGLERISQDAGEALPELAQWTTILKLHACTNALNVEADKRTAEDHLTDVIARFNRGEANVHLEQVNEAREALRREEEAARQAWAQAPEVLMTELDDLIACLPEEGQPWNAAGIQVLIDLCTLCTHDALRPPTDAPTFHLKSEVLALRLSQLLTDFCHLNDPDTRFASRRLLASFPGPLLLQAFDLMDIKDQVKLMRSATHVPEALAFVNHVKDNEGFAPAMRREAVRVLIDIGSSSSDAMDD